MSQVTLKTIAKKLNLSVSSVSKAFLNRYDVRPETREKVLALAAKLNFQPNVNASSLRTNKTKTIAVIIPEIANNFFNLAINGIESIAREENYHVLIYLTHEDYTKEVAFTNLVQSRGVDGVLVSISQETSHFNHLKELVKREIPLVYFDRINEHMKVPMVSTNDFESAYLATEHLIKQGCKKIAHVTFNKNPSIAVKRKKGYLKALNDYQLSMDPKMIIHCTENHKTDVENVKNLLNDKDRPDGIFSALEKMAMVSYEACAEMKLAIPGDVKIITFSNLEIASLLNPSLSTITQPAFQIGRAAAQTLFKILKKQIGQQSKEHLILDSQLVLRKSTMISSFFFFLACI